MEKKDRVEDIVRVLTEKSAANEKVYRNTQEVFRQMKSVCSEIAKSVNEKLKAQNPKVKDEMMMAFRDSSEFECKLRFGGEVLVMNMHTNVFTFPDNHIIFKNPYVQEDKYRAFCGKILIYNFLSDSLKFARFNDVGYLLSRLYVNAENHFFVEGIRQLGFLYTDIAHNVITADEVRNIIEECILYAIDIDLVSEPFASMREISVYDKLTAEGTMAGRKMGFEIDKIVQSKKENS